MKFFPHKNSSQSQWSMGHSRNYEQVGSNKAGSMTCVFKALRSWFAVRLFGQGLVLALELVPALQEEDAQMM